jgi:hypothetical protein
VPGHKLGRVVSLVACHVLVGTENACSLDHHLLHQVEGPERGSVWTLAGKKKWNVVR